MHLRLTLGASAGKGVTNFTLVPFPRPPAQQHKGMGFSLLWFSAPHTHVSAHALVCLTPLLLPNRGERFVCHVLTPHAVWCEGNEEEGTVKERIGMITSAGHTAGC